MANNKIDRINKEIAKTREKITEYQNKLKGLEAQKTEAENLEIVQLVRAMRLTPQELNAMPFVYVGSQDVFMLSLCYRVGKLFSDCVGFLTVHLSRFKRLYQMKG